MKESSFHNFPQYGRKMNFLLILSLLFALSAYATPSFCNQVTPPVPKCATSDPRDLLFIVDGSNSMNMYVVFEMSLFSNNDFSDKFYTDMLDYTELLYCAFDATEPNQAGMLIFNLEIKVVIPLAEYTQNEWFAKVEEIKSQRFGPNPPCCSCCTPTADAFDKALEEFNARGKNELSIAFVITDGVPSNNNPGVAGINGNPAWWFYSAAKGFNPALYATQIVPQRAQILKDASHRIFLVGIPNSDGVPPDAKYFSGGHPNGYQYSTSRAGKTFTTTYNSPPFPIVSPPVEDNSFSTSNWDVKGLIQSTVGALCKIPVTSTPTAQTTAPTTRAPTSKSPTLAPTTRAPTSKAPTPGPTSPPTPLPTSKAPTFQPSAAPTKFVIDQVDTTFLIDRSNSMNWRKDFCLSVLANLPPIPGFENPAKSPCWDLIMRYVLNQADEIVKLPAGAGGSRALGWADDFPASTPAKGLRLNLVGFACTNEQRTPKLFQYSADVGGPITSRHSLIQLLNDLRLSVMPDGGTCPGLAIEYNVRGIEETSQAQYPLQTTIMVTDGIFYDQPFPTKATTGLDAYSALRFAVGIAVPADGNNYGLTPAEVKMQRQQLLGFVGGNPQLFKDLGTEGWSVLVDIAQEIASDLPTYFVDTPPIPRYTWCGWRREHDCARNNFRQGNCKWLKSLGANWACRKV